MSMDADHLQQVVRMAERVHRGLAPDLESAGDSMAPRRDDLEVAALILAAMERPITTRVSIHVGDTCAGVIDVHHGDEPLALAEVGGVLDRARTSVQEGLRSAGVVA